MKKLYRYNWVGINRFGEILTGTMAMPTMILVKKELRKQSIIPRKVIKKDFFFTPNKKITQVAIAVFSRQMATLIANGIPLLQAMELSSKNQTNRSMRYLIENLKNAIETGLSFAEALQKYPFIFDKLFHGLITTGERSGTLALMLNRLADYNEKIATLKRKIKKSLAYPLSVVMIALGVTAVLLTYVVPQFESLCHSFGAELPSLTLAIINLANFCKNYLTYILILVSGISFSLFYAKRKYPIFADLLDLILLKIPYLGALLVKMAIARLARTLAITYNTGLSLVDALPIIALGTGNRIYCKACYALRDEVATGRQLADAMKQNHLFPPMVIQLVAIGEEAGELGAMLTKIADFYEEDVNNAIELATKLLEPLVMSLLGLFVGGIVLAMYLPIFKLGSIL